jgi:hypothetical protein
MKKVAKFVNVKFFDLLGAEANAASKFVLGIGST